MGVDWYACNECGETFPDCGEYGYCGGCEEHLCSRCVETLAKQYGEMPEDCEHSEDFGEGHPKYCSECCPVVKEEERQNKLELEYLRFFFIEADFGPAHGDVVSVLNKAFIEEYGELPEGYA